MTHEVFKFPRDKVLCNYRIENENEDYIVLRDLGPHDQYQTITNAAEWVVAQLANRLKGRALYYIDTEDCIDQLLVHDGRFAGFAHGGPYGEQTR